MYNPLIHKKPYGATAVGKKTTIVFPLDTHTGVKRVFVVLRKNDKVLRFELSEQTCEIENGEQNSCCIKPCEQLLQEINCEQKSGTQTFGQDDNAENATQQDITENCNQQDNAEKCNQQDNAEKCNKQNNTENCNQKMGSFVLDDSGIWHYRFEGELENGDFLFFGRDCDGTAVCGDWLPEWQLTVSKIDYKTPNWAKVGVTYQAFADRFCKGEDRQFEKKGTLHTDWNEQPAVETPGNDYRADDFFGGNISGILSKLDYLKSLNVTCLYLSPIFQSSSNHRYDTADYLKIDELFGDEKQFADLIKKARELGIYVMLDGVFNHTGADSLYFNKFSNFPTIGAYQSEKSPYFDWFYFNNFPNDYHSWWGSTVVPTVNKGASGYRKLMFDEGGVIDKWTKLGVKGWRLDVVDELPIDFTCKLCKTIKSIDNDALIVGEVWEDASTKVSYGTLRPYFMGEQLDSVMNYPFKIAILDFIFSGNKKEFQIAVTRILENYPKESLDVLMNLIDSHDTVRALTLLSGADAPLTKQERADFRLNEYQSRPAKQRLKVASILQFTLPGVPCVYYGDEAGQQGFEDPSNRATYPWGREDGELLLHYRLLGEMRKKYADLLQGEMTFEKDDSILIYVRRCGDNPAQVGVSNERALKVAVNPTGQVIFRNIRGFDALSNDTFDILQLEPYSAKVFITK